MAIVSPIDLLPPDDSPQKSLVEEVVKDLESYLGIQAHRISIGGLWDEKPPAGANGESLRVFLKEVGAATAELTPAYVLQGWREHVSV